jgi:hypothetical protein
MLISVTVLSRYLEESSVTVNDSMEQVTSLFHSSRTTGSVSSRSACGSTEMQAVQQVKRDLFSTGMTRHLDVPQRLSESYP